MSVFVGQTLLEIEADTSYAQLNSAVTTQILYWKPNSEEGHFDAQVSGTTLTYQIQDGDIGQKGVWRFQAFWVMSNGLTGYGKIKSKYFQTPL